MRVCDTCSGSSRIIAVKQVPRSPVVSGAAKRTARKNDAKRTAVCMSMAPQLSLSRLNHWLPRGQAHPEVVQGTAQFHYEIADALLPQADPVFDDATALHTTVDMLDPEPAVVQGLVSQLLLPRQFLAAWFLRRHEDLHLREREGQETQILQQLTPGR